MDLVQLNELVSSPNELPFMLEVNEKLYRSSNGVSQSDLKLIKSKSLYHFRYAKTANKETEALILGRAIHKAIFEWEDFKNEYMERPKDFNLNRKADKEQMKQWQDKGMTVLKRDEMTKIGRMRRSLKRRPKIFELISGCLFERSTWARCELDRLLKIRTDGYKPKTNTIVDYKTTMDASPGVFMRDIFKYGYHVQAAFYIDVIELRTGETPSFKIIAQEKSYPYEACVFELSPKSIAIGRKTYQEQLERLENALKTNLWPSYLEHNVVKPPRWLEDQAFAEVE